MLLARRLALALGIVLGAGAAGAAGAELLLESPALVPSSEPALLGPITERGRQGWECAPERRARATNPRNAGLPADD